MAYDERLAERIREAVPEEYADGLTEIKMFGGLAFMLDGHMFVGVLGEELMVRLDRDATERALRGEHVREMDFTGRAARTMVLVGQAGLADDAALARWINAAAENAKALPAKRKPKGS